MFVLREKRGGTIVFIAHDLSLAWLIADRFAIMYLGGIVEVGPAASLVADPRRPYTKALLSVPSPDLARRRVGDGRTAACWLAERGATLAGAAARPR